MILVLESMQLAAGELVTDKAMACTAAVVMSCDGFHFTFNLLLIRMSVGLSGCVIRRWFAVVIDLICAV